jgi:uncharacterized protein YciI
VAYFAVTRERGPRWNPSVPMREQERWDDHAAFMDGLVDNGVIVLGGPIGGGDRRFLLIFDAESADAIEAGLEEDPWTPMGMLRIASIEPWEILLRA